MPASIRPVRKEIYVEKNVDIRTTTRKIGREVNDSSKAEPVTFVSRIRNLMLFKEGDYLIKFDNNRFITNDTSDIDFLRKHPLKDQVYWEKEFPPEVVQKMKEDKKYIEIDEEAFELAE